MVAPYWVLWIFSKYFVKYPKFRKKRTDLKLREVSALSISLASQLYPRNDFQFFLLHDSASQELKARNARLGLISGGGRKTGFI